MAVRQKCVDHVIQIHCSVQQTLDHGGVCREQFATLLIRQVRKTNKVFVGDARLDKPQDVLFVGQKGVGHIIDANPSIQQIVDIRGVGIEQFDALLIRQVGDV